MKLMSEPSFLSGNAEAHLKDDLSYIGKFSRHLTRIYSPRDVLCLDKQFTHNKSTSIPVE